MLQIKDIKVREDLSNEQVLKLACKKNRINFSDVLSWNIFKKSIDARDKDDVHYVYTINIEHKFENRYKHLIKESTKSVPEIDVRRSSSLFPVIVGAGPAGLFAGLTLVEHGIRPIIVEQGDTVLDRKKKVDEFLNSGKLDLNSNVQFGEGGAGTFSDGKLTTGISSPFCKKVLEDFCRFGAPEQILYSSKPHIGTDNLINVIKNMRDYIILHGGIFLFNTKATDFEIVDGKIAGVKVSSVLEKDGFNMFCHSTEDVTLFATLLYNGVIKTDSVILAIGHSSRDTFEMLYEKGLDMDKKNFSVGVRIEHKQDMINSSQYGDKTKLKLPPADYKLSYHSDSTGRSVYTFCMCPGGVVMASSSDEGTIVTNGMSTFARDGENANSAVLVNVTPDDFADESPLAGVYFQKDLEEKAFKLGGLNYFAPVQRVEDFIENRKSTFIGDVKPTYKPGVTLSNLNEILPDFVSSSLKEGILYFDKKIKGFADPDAILTGLETRSSSPVKIVRNSNTLESNVLGIYPCGEGAGYAGGIMSAAVDGIKCAIKVLEKI